jgi:imidazole glycerol phosphate synthase glutamine amidotransferase subunit
MQILILDLGLNNINSVYKSVRDNARKDDVIKIISEQHVLKNPSLIILPGLGKFEAAMSSLRNKQFHNLIRENLALGGSLTGICLGMHLLASESEESPGVQGLNLIPGVVRKLLPSNSERIPNIGWNSTEYAQPENSSFGALNSNNDFYFVHSFALEPEDKSHILATTPYGEESFVSAVLNSKLVAFQFHPEKSARPGNDLMEQTINWARS